MPSLFESVGGLRKRLGPAGRNLLNRALYEAIYSIPAVGRFGFFNGGFHPVPPDLLPVPALAGSPLQAAFYDHALRVLPGPLPAPPRAVLDIGCGLGGGLLYAAGAFPGARLAGADTALQAVRGARRRLARAGVAADLRVARGDRLPFPDAGFDVVVSIGTLTYVGYAPFMREAARVLAPGGVLSVTGGTMRTPITWTQARLAGLARENGLALQGFADITANCLAAAEAEAPRTEAMIRSLPSFFRAYAREWAVLPGSTRHAMYHDGRKKDFSAVFAKPQAGAGA